MRVQYGGLDRARPELDLPCRGRYQPSAKEDSLKTHTLINPCLKVPFANLYTVFEKNALSPSYDTGFNEWVKKHPEVATFIIVGDCTDLCVYTIAMHLRMQANALQLKRKVIVPANAVATYDMSVEKAKELGALSHDAELLHDLFLYHMALNAIEVYKEIK